MANQWWRTLSTHTQSYARSRTHAFGAIAHRAQLCSRAFEFHTHAKHRAAARILFIVKSFTKSIEYKCQGFWFNFGVDVFMYAPRFALALMLCHLHLGSVSFTRIHKHTHSYAPAFNLPLILTQFNVLHHFSSRFHYVREMKTNNFKPPNAECNFQRFFNAKFYV